MNPDNSKSTSRELSAKILIASDNISDATTAKKMLTGEFDKVFISTDPDLTVQDFEQRSPDVLVLAFNTLEKAECYYLGLYRRNVNIQLQPHRTVILCSKTEVNNAYQACKKEYFDDYVLFWPMALDAPRLLMSVHLALRELAAASMDAPSAASFAAQARRLDKMSGMLDQQIVMGNQRLEAVSLDMQRAEQQIDAALDAMTNTLSKEGSSDLARTGYLAELQQEISNLKRNDIKPHLQTVVQSLQPVTQWTNELARQFAPFIDTAQALNAMAESIHPVILIIDDDEFQHKILRHQLAPVAHYHLEFAISGAKALNILRKVKPDLILMDITMPDMDGIETTRRIKAIPQFAKIPIIMVTGNSEGASVIDSLKAGAVNFVVKPIDRDTLIKKIASALHSA